MSFRSGARLRLRPPRALRRRPRLPRPTALLLVVLLIGALGTAYRFYLDGVPGSPQLPTWTGATDANSAGDAMVILAPPGVVVRQRVLLGKVDARHDNPVRLAASEPDSMLKLDPGLIQLSVDIPQYEPRPFDLILQLASGARVPRLDGIRAFSFGGDTPPVIVDGPYSLWELAGGSPDRQPPSDTDYVVLHVTPPPAHVHENGETSLYRLQFELLLRPLWPFAVRDNARVVLRTPSFHGFVKCGALDAFMRYLVERGPRFPAMDCHRPEPPDELATTVVLDVERAEWKTDLLYPAPAEGGRSDVTDDATWWTASGPVRVTGNYVNINAEAAGQRWLFLSGLLAGFALGLVPVVVEKVRYPRDQRAARGRARPSRPWSPARRR
ncbi:hypothetical protein [Lentzea terrae]|uniref:hypothetical protein n=1 Tax=Lentzea terrae TaxID=2200761 RepID=UPI000DD42BDE|nr:hypothetical protein [Lentzea terrae]